MFNRFLLLILFSIASAQSFAATGKFYDSLTGTPIAGATVYAAWYYQFLDRQRCGGTALAVTDDRGEYTLDLWTAVNLTMHDYEFWVVAPGYYDPWQVARNTSDPRIKILPQPETPPAKSTSRAMTQIANVPIDAQLLAIQNGTRSATCSVRRTVRVLRSYR